MPVYIVTPKTGGEPVYRYHADAPVDWPAYPLADFDHVEAPPPPAPPPPPPYKPEDWHIGVGPFWDRFGAYKIGILASADPVVQAIIKDSSVRKYLDLKGRRADLEGALNVLIAKGFPLDKAAILDVQPGPLEVHRG
jgi:hypothetical protein